MEAIAREIVMLETAQRKVPFEEWFSSIRDIALRAAIDARLTRVVSGNFGDHKMINSGIYELRIPKGPGLRVYYGLDGSRVVVLIGGGDKSSQRKDIKIAVKLWKEYLDAK